jgi:hypothetical protein
MSADTPQDPIAASFDAQGEKVWSGSFNLATFFSLDEEKARELGWQMVEKLKTELPDNRAWSAYTVKDGLFSITSRRRIDVEANLTRLEVLANLEANGIVL